MTTRASALIAGVATSLAVIAATYGAGGSQPDPKQAAADDRAAQANDHARASAAAASMGVMRRSRRADDVVSGPVVGSPLLNDGVADVDSSRVVVLDSGHPAWVMPGIRESVCIAHDGFLNCPPAAEIAERGASIYVSGRGDEVHIGGLVADGVSRVLVTLRDGTVRDATVTANVFDITTTQPPTTITWAGGPQGEGQEKVHSEEFGFPSR